MLMSGYGIPNSTPLLHPPMVMVLWVPILVGNAADAALLPVMVTQEPKVTRTTTHDRRSGNMDSLGTPLLTSREAVLAALLEAREVVLMTQGRHHPVAQNVLDDVGV